MRVVPALTVLAAATALAAACRTGEPGEDPETPANTPLPRIAPKDPDPSPGPALFGKDAG